MGSARPGGGRFVTGFQAVALAVGAVACVTDVRFRKVPNWLTASAVLAGLSGHVIAPGGQGLVAAALGMAVGLAVFFPFFALGGMGGGDVKLMAALGTWIGWSAIIWTALYGAVAGGVLGLAVALAQGYLRQALSNIGGLFLFWSAQGVRPMPSLTLERGHGPRLPYALPIFVGLVAALWRQ
jgi:prepilin peptidase CpaA